MSFVQPKVYVTVNALYKVVKLKQEVAYSDFNTDILKFYLATKGNKPENVVVMYTEETVDTEGNTVYNEFSKTLEEIGREDICKTIRAVAATGACIFLRKNDVDCKTISEIYCLGIHKASLLLADRGNIFSRGSELRINCKTTAALMDELLK